MTEHERRSIARHRHQAQTYRDLASDHELMAEAPAEEWEHALPFLQEIPKGHAPAWYQEQAAHYRAQAAHRTPSPPWNMKLRRKRGSHNFPLSSRQTSGRCMPRA